MMPALTSPPCFDPPPFDRTTAQVGVARELALCGRAAPARRLCGALFLDNLPLIMRDRALLQLYVECLLLLEMSALLPRLLRAMFGVDLDMVQLGEPRSGRWALSFGNGITLLIPARCRWTNRAEQEKNAALWTCKILSAAAEEGSEAALPMQPSEKGPLVPAGFGAES